MMVYQKTAHIVIFLQYCYKISNKIIKETK